MNLPNKLTVLRIIMIPIFVIFYYVTAIPHNFIFSAVIFALAAVTDFLDGYIARKYNMVTDFGKFLDPIADKVLVSTALIVLLVPPVISEGALVGTHIGYTLNTAVLFPNGTWSFVAPVCVAIILARELIISGFRLIAAGKGMVISADKSGKLKTFFTDLAILYILIAGQFYPAEFTTANLIGLILLGVATLLTVVSGVECFVKNKKVISSK